MQEYDAALKLLLQASADSVLRQVTGGIRVTRWLKTDVAVRLLDVGHLKIYSPVKDSNSQLDLAARCE
jgi:hypothetical protein